MTKNLQKTSTLPLYLEKTIVGFSALPQSIKTSILNCFSSIKPIVNSSEFFQNLAIDSIPRKIEALYRHLLTDVSTLLKKGHVNNALALFKKLPKDFKNSVDNLAIFSQPMEDFSNDKLIEIIDNYLNNKKKEDSSSNKQVTKKQKFV